MSGPVLDASPVLAVIFDEPGGDHAAAHIPGAKVSAVNAAEVLTKLTDLGMPEGTIEAIFEDLQLTIIPFDLAHARESARLRPQTRQAGLSLGDRACLATAGLQKVPALSTDRAWARLPAGIEVAVELLR